MPVLGVSKFGDRIVECSVEEKIELNTPKLVKHDVAVCVDGLI